MRKSGVSFNYTDQIPGYDAGDNPLEDILPDRPPPPTDVPIDPGLRPRPPADVPIDPGLGGGDGSGSPSGVDPILPDTPPDDPIMGDVPIDPGLGGGDGSGSSSGVGPDFKPHMMYDPETGQGVTANTYQDHLHYQSLGYTHEKPGKDAGSNGDFVLLGLASVVFFGSLIFGMRK
jgi:hypothetical protein